MRNFNKIQKQTKYVQLLKTRTPMMMMMTDNIRGRGLIFSVSKNWGKMMLWSIARVKLVVAERWCLLTRTGCPTRLLSTADFPAPWRRKSQCQKPGLEHEVIITAFTWSCWETESNSVAIFLCSSGERCCSCCLAEFQEGGGELSYY
jgi:hypothetical protein